MLGLLGKTVGDGRRVKRALRSAQVLDEVVAAQLALVSRLPEDSRRRAADYLAELVMLAQSYRHFAAGWITRRELERRGTVTMERLAELRKPQQRAQFTEQD